MRTLVIRVDEPGPGEQRCAVVAYFDDGSPDWQRRVRARAEIPIELPPSGEPETNGDVHRLLLGGSPTAEGQLGRVGAHLHDLLVSGEVGAFLDEVRRSAQEPSAIPVRIVVDVRPPALRRLPWELINRRGMRPFIDRDNPWVRGSSDDWERAHQELFVPLRVLVVVGDPNDERLLAEDEVRAIVRGLATFHGRLYSEVLRAPSRTELMRELDQVQPNVLHFIGHGDVREDDAMPRLELADRSDRSGRRWWLTRDELANALSGKPPRLVVLNACRTADVNVAEGSWGIAEALAELGVLAVVSMQGDIPSAASVAFTAAFYESLGHGQAVDAAVSAGRHAVQAETDLERRDWALPSLTVWARPERILQLRCGASQEDMQALPGIHEFHRVRLLVDRDGLRQVWWRLDHYDRSEPASRVLVVTGERQVGKTDLVHSWLLTCYVRGRRLTYVNLDDEPYRWLRMLRRIRDGRSESRIAPRLADYAPAAFRRWGQTVNRVARGEWSSAAVNDEDDRGEEFRSVSAVAEEDIDKAFASFRAALLEAAGGEPLIIVLDHLARVDKDDFTRYVWPMLVSEVAERRLDPVRLILVLRPEERGKLVPRPPLAGDIEEVPVLGFEPAEFPHLMREYSLRVGSDPDDAERFLAEYAELLAKRGPTWKPDLLAKTHGLIAG